MTDQEARDEALKARLLESAIRSIRDELDQTPAWWDRQYSGLVARTFYTAPFDPAAHEGHDVVEVRNWTGAVVVHLCGQCPTVLVPQIT